MSVRLTLLSFLSRRTVRPLLARARSPEANRKLLERAARRWFRAPPYALYRDSDAGSGGLWISARPGSHPPRPGKLILYVHGGGFISGSPRTHAAMCARLAWLTGVEVFAPRYRLAPTDPFPAGRDDIRAAWEAVIAKGYRPRDVILAGDSAGANLIFGLLADLCAEGTCPAGVVALSPIADFTFSGASIADNAATECMLPAERRDELVDWYLGKHDPADPHASPLFASYTAPPPVLIQYAENELLRDDGVRLAQVLRDAGGEVVVQTWPRAPHVFQIFDGWVPEARDALTGVADFVKRCLA